MFSHRKGLTILAAVLAAANIAALSWIGVSAFSGGKAEEALAAYDPADFGLENEETIVYNSFAKEQPSQQGTEAAGKPTSQPFREVSEIVPQDVPEDIPQGLAAYPDPAGVSTAEHGGIPESEAFDWKDGWRFLSGDAVPITDCAALTGGWKAYMISDPKGKIGGRFDDYLNVEFSGNADSLIITMNWDMRFFYDGGGSIDVSGSPSDFSGSFRDDAITATGAGSLTITDFVIDKGVEYARGVYTWPDGVTGYIGLTRP